jgi:hypothetical protein
MTYAEFRANLKKQEELRKKLVAEVDDFKNTIKPTLTVSLAEFLKDGLILRKK